VFATVDGPDPADVTTYLRKVYRILTEGVPVIASASAAVTTDEIIDRHVGLTEVRPSAYCHAREHGSPDDRVLRPRMLWQG
jgi:hypothetical protein